MKRVSKCTGATMCPVRLQSTSYSPLKESWNATSDSNLFLLGCIMSKELLELMKRVKVQQYKEIPPLKLLYETLHEIETTLHYGRSRNWDILVEMLAMYHGIVKQTRYLDLYHYLNELDLLNAYTTASLNKPWDYLGDIFLEQDLAGLGQNLTPKNVVDLMIEMTLPKPITKIQTVLDPCVGTGRFLIETSLLRRDSPLILFGIEINIGLYRACIVNMKMFATHPYSIICADTLRLDPDITGPASQIWDLGNRWDPPDMSAFFWKPPPINPESFSLKAFTETKQEEGESHG